ncbi:MAG: HAMP domain-containing sensor histidine kinase [Pseudomonadota bacterium]
MSRKWRPSLWFVLGGALAGTLALSLIGLIVLRYLGPEIGFRNAAKMIAGLIGLLTVVLWLLLLRLLLRPVSALSDYAAAMRDIRAKPRDPPHRFGTRELHDMGQSVIDMATTLRAREGTIRSYTDHVTHELKTPVSTVRAATELLEDSPGLSDQDRHLVEQIRAAGVQMEDQLAALREVARAREVRYRGQTALADLRTEMRQNAQGLSVAVEGETDLPMSIAGLRIVLGQLLRNARDHGAGQVTLSTRREGNSVILHVQDDGRGISPGNRDRIFAPFFTTRRDSGGTGMGLFIVRSLLEVHGGAITWVPSATGTAVEIRLTAP